MSAKQYDNTNTGGLWKNDKTGGNPNWPDYRGKINVEGREFWLDAWLRKDKNGNTYMSLSIKPKVDKGERVAQNDKPAEPQKDFDDSEIPF